ncbi:MAG TPA: caspase family protein, partial [Chroococcales cyanobacterium]
MFKTTGKLARLLLSASLACYALSPGLPALALEIDSSDESSADAPIEDKWALVVGISKFENPSLNLQFPAKDATDFATYLTKEAHFAPDHVKLLTDEAATKEQILKLLGDSWLPRVAHPHDLVVIYVSSHGSPSTMDVCGTNYIVTHNTDPESLYATGLPMQELTSAIKDRIHSDRIVVILDACHSGSARATKDLTLASNFDAESIAAGVGQMVICSSKPNQVSFESKRKQNGVFTEQLLAGLRSKGEKTNMKDAFGKMKEGVESEVLADRGELQTPVMKMKWEGDDLV